MTRPGEHLVRTVRLNDRPLVVKFGIAPAAMLIVFALATAATLGALFYARNAAQGIANHEIRIVARLGDISGRFQHAEAELSRLMVDRAMGARGTDVPARAAAIQSALARIRSDLVVMRPMLSPPERRRMGGVLQQLDRYSDAVTVVGSMLDVDFSASVTMLAPFRANADRVVADVDRMVDVGVADARVHADLVVARTRSLIVLSVSLLILLGAIAVIVPWLIGRTVTASILCIADATRQLAAGDHNLDLDAFARGDELGRIVHALKIFRSQAIEKEILEKHFMEEEERRAHAVAQANDESRRQRQAMIEELTHAFETKVQGMIREVEDATGNVEAHAASLQATIRAANVLAGELENQAEAFANEMQEAGTATDELIAAIRSIDHDVDHTSRIATAIRHRAASASRRVGDSDSRAADVERVVDVIDDIARQTKLLALNATIEAARCGEQGRGFSVVAAEIKALSSRTGISTGEVRHQVHAVQEGVSEAVSETAALSALIDEMEAVANSVSDASRAQAQSTGRIETRITAVRNRSETLSHVSLGIRASAQGNEKSLIALRSDSSRLQQALEELRVDARAFTGLLRAG